MKLEAHAKMVEEMETGKRQLSCYLDNNEGKELNAHRIREFSLGNVFDAFISSCIVRMRKPDPAIFKLALGIAQARPHECVYFDDRPMLVEAAKKRGITAYHLTGFESTKNTVVLLTQRES